MKINWKQKLASRKFWAAVAAYATSLLGAFNISDSTTAQVVLIITGIGALTVYMLAEAWTDTYSKDGDREDGDK